MSGRLLRVVYKTQRKGTPISHPRCLSTGKTPEKGEHIKPPGGLITYIVKKYVNYIEQIQLKAKEDYPKFYKIYRLFKDGIVEFFSDTKLYSVVATRIWAGQDLTGFTWKELETYRQMPSDLLRSAPVLIAAPLPAVPYFFYPICYVFPRQLLCRHFWTNVQKEQFGVYYLRQRLRYYPHVVETMERQSVYIPDVAQRHLLEEIMFKIRPAILPSPNLYSGPGSTCSNNLSNISNVKPLKLEHGSHPTVEELLEVKPLFIHKPFGLNRMSKLQRWYLARSLGFSTLVQSRFKNDAILLHNIDLALLREGLDMLSMEQLQSSCFYRGYNAEGQTETQLKTYLNQWLGLSQKLEEESLSLLLHAPVLLSYNKPSNRKYLIHEIDIRGNVRR